MSVVGVVDAVTVCRCSFPKDESYFSHCGHCSHPEDDVSADVQFGGLGPCARLPLSRPQRGRGDARLWHCPAAQGHQGPVRQPGGDPSHCGGSKHSPPDARLTSLRLAVDADDHAYHQVVGRVCLGHRLLRLSPCCVGSPTSHDMLIACHRFVWASQQGAFPGRQSCHRYLLALLAVPWGSSL